MLSICAYIERVGGERVENGSTMENAIFTALAKKLIQSGLIREDHSHAEGEALLYIIPAFVRFGLLPQVNSLPDG